MRAEFKKIKSEKKDVRAFGIALCVMLTILGAVS